MKFRYYLRGAGVGIIVTTIILAIAFSNNKPTMSADEIIKEAEKLGMIMPEESDKEDEMIPDDESESGGENGTPEGDGGQDDSEGNAGTENPDDSGAVSGEVSGDQGQQDETQQTQPDAGTTVVILKVEDGDSSRMVSEKLLELGLITDAKDFDKWLCQVKGLGSFIRTGEHEIPLGATYEEIAAIITNK